MLQWKLTARSMFTRKEERCKNDYLIFYLKKWEMILILGGDGKTSQLIFVRFEEYETKPGNDHSGKETNVRFRSEILMTRMQNSIRNKSKSNPPIHENRIIHHDQWGLSPKCMVGLTLKKKTLCNSSDKQNKREKSYVYLNQGFIKPSTQSNIH